MKTDNSINRLTIVQGPFSLQTSVGELHSFLKFMTVFFSLSCCAYHFGKYRAQFLLALS